MPLSDLSEQSRLIGTTAGLLLLSWIKRKGKPRSLFSFLNIWETGKAERKISGLILEQNSELIAVLITRQHNGNIAHFGPQQ